MIEHNKRKNKNNDRLNDICKIINKVSFYLINLIILSKTDIIEFCNLK